MSSTFDSSDCDRSLDRAEGTLSNRRLLRLSPLLLPLLILLLLQPHDFRQRCEHELQLTNLSFCLLLKAHLMLQHLVKLCKQLNLSPQIGSTHFPAIEHHSGVPLTHTFLAMMPWVQEARPPRLHSFSFGISFDCSPPGRTPVRYA